jgi:hypothetical protein
MTELLGPGNEQKRVKLTRILLDVIRGPKPIFSVDSLVLATVTRKGNVKNTHTNRNRKRNCNQQP